MSVYVTRSSMPDINDFIDEIRPIFESHILTNMGPVYKKFQSQLIKYLEVPELSLFVNGHMALEMAIQALNIKKHGEELGGGEVITTPFTFVSTTHADTDAESVPCCVQTVSFWNTFRTTRQSLMIHPHWPRICSGS